MCIIQISSNEVKIVQNLSRHRKENRMGERSYTKKTHLSQLVADTPQGGGQFRMKEELELPGLQTGNLDSADRTQCNAARDGGEGVRLPPPPPTPPPQITFPGLLGGVQHRGQTTAGEKPRDVRQMGSPNTANAMPGLMHNSFWEEKRSAGTVKI